MKKPGALFSPQKKAEEASFNASDSTGQKRDPREQFIKSLLGMIAEDVCMLMLRYFNVSEKITIRKGKSASSIDQINLWISKEWEKDGVFNKKDYSLEVRSSIPFKGFEHSACMDFDILGKYFNNVKPNECLKGLLPESSF